MANSTQLNMAQRMVDASICSYHIGAAGFTQSTYWDPIGIVGTPTTFTDGVDHINAAFVGQTDDGWIVISVRGTLPPTDSSWKNFIKSFDDWWQDSETEPVPFTFQSVDAGCVEKGFLEATESIWPGLESYLDAIDWSAVRGVQITGHSKGAAMTFLIAARIRIRYAAAKAIHVNAFAAPAAGDSSFAAWYRAAGLDATTTRHQRTDDLVPFLPAQVGWNLLDHLPSSFLGGALSTFKAWLYGGYEVVGSVIYYPGAATTPGVPIPGQPGELAAQLAIVAAIKADEYSALAAAHSAVCSYWPGLFQIANTDAQCSAT